MLINRQRSLETLCEELRESPPLAFDTEFIRERRYWPKLCLIQVRSGNPENPIEALIDPFEVSLRPLLNLFEDESLLKILHAGSQDLEILYMIYGCQARNVFDTQIAAAFLGYGFQVGYADLVSRALEGVQISKTSQYTDWAARPLSQAQVEYALADVLHLHPLYQVLEARLRERGRLPWALEEFRRAEDRAGEVTPDEDLYLKLKLSGLNRRQLAVLRELAIARDKVGQDLDKPAVYVLPDPALIQMSRQPPNSANGLRAMRGVTSSVTEFANDFLAAIRKGQQTPEDKLPRLPPSERADPQIQVISGVLGLVAQARAADHELARQYLAPLDQVNELASWWIQAEGNDPPDMPLLQGWRRELLGQELLELLNGRIALALDPDAWSTNRASPLKIVKL